MVLPTHYSTRTLPGRLEGDEQWRETNLGLNPVGYLGCKGQITDFWGLSTLAWRRQPPSEGQCENYCAHLSQQGLFFVFALCHLWTKLQAIWGLGDGKASTLPTGERSLESLNVGAGGHREGHEDEAAHFRDEHTRHAVCFPHSPQTCGAAGRPPGECLLMGEVTWEDLRKKIRLNLMVKVNHLASWSRFHSPHYFAQTWLSESGPVPLKGWFASHLPWVTSRMFKAWA